MHRRQLGLQQWRPMLPLGNLPGAAEGRRIQPFRAKVLDLGEQLLTATTEDGEATEVLFQVADVSRPLVSVSAICDMGNRVMFRKAGGVVRNVATGKETPVYRKNGIYVLTIWLDGGRVNV